MSLPVSQYQLDEKWGPENKGWRWAETEKGSQPLVKATRQ